MKTLNFKRLWFVVVFLFTVLFFAGCDLFGSKQDESKWDTPQTDSLSLNYSYEGKSFLNNGIGKVELLKVVDGDTIHFTEGRETIKVRFLCINTPESTGSIDPWGKAASNFVKEVCADAYEFVLECEGAVGGKPTTDTTGDRYLGYVWYRPSEDAEFRCLNLEILENCYSYYTGKSEKYDTYFRAAYETVRELGKRVFGEQDPDFNYDKEVKNITIAQLRDNFSSYSTGNNLKLKARIIRKIGAAVYLEDLEDTVLTDEDGVTTTLKKSAIYCYHSFLTAFNTSNVGDVVEFQCQASFSEDYGYQLIGPKNLRRKEIATEEVTAATMANVITIPTDVTSLEAYEGFVVKLEGVKVTSVGRSNEDTHAYTIYCTMANGSELMIRVDGDVIGKPNSDAIEKGATYTVVGGVARYVNSYEGNKLYFQIKLCNNTISSGDLQKIS